MNSGSFKVFHYAGYKYFLSVAYGVNLNLAAKKVSVNKHRVFAVFCKSLCKIFCNLLFVIGYFHSLSAKNV